MKESYLDLNKRVYVSEIKEVFGLKQVAGDEESLSRWVIVPDINRPGLELSGYKGQGELKRVVVLGNKETKYLESLDYDTQVDRFGFLTDSYTPCIIVTAGLEAPKALVDVASAKNFPVFEFQNETYILSEELTAFLSEKLATVSQIGGEMVNVYGVGVMVTGKSGIGKSELTLDLVKRGHMLVADDVVEYSRFHNKIVCTAPENTKKMLEVRGLGILDITLMFGAQSFLDRCELDFVIKLVSSEEYRNNNRDRLSPAENTMNFFGIEKVCLEIPITEGKTMGTIVEAAVVNYILRNRGIDTNERFKESIRISIENKNRGN